MINWNKKNKQNNSKHLYLPIVAGFTAVMIKSDPVCNTGDLITITLIHGGQIFSSSAKERNTLSINSKITNVQGIVKGIHKAKIN